jgi:hypothetical protein
MRAIIPLKTVEMSGRTTAVLDVPTTLRTGELAGRRFAFGGLSHASSGCQSLATSVLAVVIELKSLEVPDALTLLKE